jgi:hypothetical protein
VCEIENKFFEVDGKEGQVKDEASTLSAEDRELLEVTRNWSKNFPVVGLLEVF